MATTRTASAQWKGDLFSGEGKVAAESSKAFSELDVTWKARAESAQGKTSPEELIAAAHAACFSMALSKALSDSGHTAERLSVNATVAFDPVKLTVDSSKLQLQAKVPGIEPERFQQVAQAAKDGCPVSKALAGSVAIELEASLEG